MTMLTQDHYWLNQAVSLAHQAAKKNEVPVGAVIVMNNECIAEGHNQPIKTCDPTAHAEIVALRDAAAYCQNYRLVNATLYVTLEPCAMCLGAMIQARIKRLVFGAFDARSGAVSSVFNLLDAPQLNHRISFEGGLLADVCAKLLKDFFQERRG